MRSLLFIPGDSERKLAKAASSGADAVILDLEDSVAPAQKSAARKTTAAYLTTAAPSSPSLCVRINSLDTTDWQSDLDAIAETPPAYVMLPKSRGGQDVRTLESALADREMHTTRMIVLITEVPISLLRLESYVVTSNAAKTMAAMTWGAEDLSVELGARHNRDTSGNFTSPYQMVRNLTLITAAAAGVTAIDTVFTNFRDLDALAREASEAARDGFSGKLAIHPAQVPVINEAFTPTPDQLERAHAILDAYAQAGDAIGVINLDGEMIDEPHRRQAERLIERSKRYSI